MSKRDIGGGEATANQYAVVLPCEPDYFRDFVAGLLGKPQTITKEIFGAFELNKDDIANFYHLVIQRVGQQNESTLIQFTVRIVYDDESTVLLNSFDDFISYNEVKAVASTGAHLSWTFLVKFQDKNVPEKQQIDVSISTEARYQRILNRTPVGEYIIRGLVGNFSLRINHTARTWGADMEALLSGHIANLIKHEHQLKNFIRDKSAWIGFIVGIGTFLSSVVACFYSTGLLVDSRLGQVRGIQDPTAKASYLAELIAAGVWSRFFFSIICFLFISFVVSVALGIWSGFSAENQQPSFLLLSKQAEKLKQKTLTNYKRAWMWFVLSIAGAIIIELVGNTLFTRYLEKWVVP